MFVANAAFSLGTVLFEIPTGVVADTLGPAHVIPAQRLRARRCRRCSTSGWRRSDAGVVAFAVASMFMALGFTFYSGAMEAWLVDALAATGYRGILDRVFARGQQVTAPRCSSARSAEGCSGRSTSRIPYVVRSVLLVAVFVVAFVVMHDVGFTPRRVTAAELPREIARQRDGRASRSAGGSGRFVCSCSRPLSRVASSAGRSTRRSRICSSCSRAMRCGSSASSRPASRSRRSPATRSSDVVSR